MSHISNFEKDLSVINLDLQKNVSLAKYTTMKVGGNATFLVIVENSDALYKVLSLAKKYEFPFVILGKGSNVVISDAGYQGLVIINTSTNWEILEEQNLNIINDRVEARFKSDYSGFNSDIDNKDEEPVDLILVRADSGVGVNYLMHALYKEGITGLEWFSGIPSTVGGAIYMNMHGGEHFFGNIVHGATLFDGLKIKSVSHKYFHFDYDWSILHDSREIVLKADLILKKGNLQKAQQLTKEWAMHKAQQPKRSAGCIFRNISYEEKEKLRLPTTSAGYLIDQVLGLKGLKIGDAIISDKHAAFIENLGQATARDVYDLIQLVKTKAKKELGLDLQEEVQLLGLF